MYNEKEIIEYYTVTLPEQEWVWSYSAKELAPKLSGIIAGQRLTAMYVGLSGYLDAFGGGTNLVDLTYVGPGTLLVFEDKVIELIIYVEGMTQYRIFERSDIKMKATKDYVPSDYFVNDSYFYDIANYDITHEYSGQRVKEVLVSGTDEWAFTWDDFDESLAAKAAENNDLTTEIDLVLENGTAVKIIGDYLECYRIEFDSANQ